MELKEQVKELSAEELQTLKRVLNKLGKPDERFGRSFAEDTLYALFRTVVEEIEDRKDKFYIDFRLIVKATDSEEATKKAYAFMPMTTHDVWYTLIGQPIKHGC